MQRWTLSFWVTSSSRHGFRTRWVVGHLFSKVLSRPAGAVILRARVSLHVLSSAVLFGCASLSSGALLSGCSGDIGELFGTVREPSEPPSPGAIGGASGAGGAFPVRLGLDAGAPIPSSRGGSGGGSIGPVGVGRAGGAGAGNDAGVERAPPSEPADAAPECDPCPCSTGPFGPPELVRGLGLDTDVFGPALSADGLSLFFSSIDGDEDIFSATRADRGSEFTSATRVANLDEEGSADGTPFLSADGLSLYFFSIRSDPAAPGNRDLWVARRPEVGGGFEAPSLLAGVNSEALDHLPRLSSDELTLMFVSGRASENAFSNIWIAERESRDGPFSEPIELAGINTDVREEGFSLSGDGLTLFFASNRADDLDMDIWVATRPSRFTEFGEVENLIAVNTPSADLDPALSADGFELFFASDRNGSVQLFRSARQCVGP